MLIIWTKQISDWIVKLKLHNWKFIMTLDAPEEIKQKGICKNEKPANDDAR